MKGIGIKEYGGVGVLEEISLSRPLPQPDDVLIEVKADGVNPVDWEIREGRLRKPFLMHSIRVIQKLENGLLCT
ncbi:hypothetical protein ACXM0N_19560 [Peribacillus simplex]